MDFDTQNEKHHTNNEYDDGFQQRFRVPSHWRLRAARFPPHRPNERIRRCFAFIFFRTRGLEVYLRQ